MHRRKFLDTLTRGTAAAATLPLIQTLEGSAQGPTAKWRMRLATSSIHYMHLPIEQACEQIAELGFEGVDIWSGHAGCPHLDDVLDRLGADGLKKLLEKTKLDLFAFSVYRGGYRKYAELLGQVGGGVAVRGSSRPCEPAELQTRMREFLESLKPDVELAEQHNGYLAIENHGHALLDSLDSFKAFVDMNQSPRLGVAVAPYHLQGVKAPVEEVIAACGKQLFFFYAWQRGGGTEQLPGHGPTDFTPWIKALAKARYSGYVNPFMHGELGTEEMTAALAKSRDYLKECARKAGSG